MRRERVVTPNCHAGIPEASWRHENKALPRGWSDDITSTPRSPKDAFTRPDSLEDHMKVLIKPRLQKDKWSLYWKTSMATRTHALDDFELDVDPSTDTPKKLRAEVARTIGLPPEAALCRLEGFVEPWELACVIVAHSPAPAPPPPAPPNFTPNTTFKTQATVRLPETTRATCKLMPCRPPPLYSPGRAAGCTRDANSTTTRPLRSSA